MPPCLFESKNEVDFFGEVVVEEQGFEKIEDELPSLGSESVNLEKERDVLEDIWASEKLLFHLDLFSEVIDGLQLIDTVEQVADVLDNLLFLIRELYLVFQCREGCIDSFIVGDRALEFVRIDIEQSLWVLGQTHGSH